MAYTVTKRTSYGQRVKNSFGGIFLGILLFIAGTCLLWWNEGRAVKTTKMLKEAQANYVEMGDINSINPEYDGKLVHATGLAVTDDVLTDPIFNVACTALNLSRKVEYYQWVEHSKTMKKDKIGGGEEETTTYTYDKQWSDKAIESSKFADPQYHNANFVLLNGIEDEKLYASHVSFGAYKLNENQIHSIGTIEKLNVELPEGIVKSLSENAAQSMKDYRNKILKERVAADSTSGSSLVHVNGNVVYVGRSANSPQIGDMRIIFEKAVPGNVSLIAVVSGDTFTGYTAKNGKIMSVITNGTQAAEAMFASEHATNKAVLWIFRIVGVLIVIFGLRNIFDFLHTLAKVLPFLANIIGFGVGAVCSIIGFVWSLLIIALAWLFYRPMLGILLIVIAAAIIFLFSKKSKELLRKNATATTEEPATTDQLQNP
ncbi:MAG: TMEM43 family protein [Bacteroidales bacterium]|nr:TMEM43 family protein [Bacteroidales bacterium]MDY6002498.1 TMEM43 family protein [Candidatus Cryptobacteroides sp.]